MRCAQWQVPRKITTRAARACGVASIVPLNPTDILRRLLCFAAILACVVSLSARATDDTQPAASSSASAAPKESWWKLLHDPKDGHLDMSRWLLQHRGVLIVPIIVTEPAVGNGGGAAAVFFRPASQSEDSKASGERIPPNIYGFGALKTENGTNGYGLAGEFHFADDRWRYKGAVGKASVNLDFYTRGILFAPRKIGYNLDGKFSFQQVSRRLGGIPLYLSLRWIYIDLDSHLNVQSNRQFFEPKDFAQRSSGLGFVIEYDSRDNTLTPTKGILSMVDGTFYLPGAGSNNTYQSYRAHTLAYVPLAPAWILGLRADYRSVHGDTPFYQLPSIDLRGISYGRYQDTSVAMLEAELRWNMSARWAVLAFGGAGRAWGRHDDFADASNEVAKGVGLRYLLARQLGLYVGLDWAWGPGEHAHYLQVGSAWR